MADNKQQKGQDLTQVISSAVQGLVANANRLGLTWQVHLASVTATTGTAVYVTVDGDTEQVVAQSMIGTIGPSERVYVLAIPPGGMFVIGKASRNRIGCTVSRVALQTLPDAGAGSTLLSWDTVTYDPMKMWVRGSPTIVTIQTPGIWACSFATAIGSPVTGRALGGLIAGGRFWRISMVAGEQFVGGGITLPLNTGDQVTVEQYADMATASTMIGILHCYLVGQ